jgi:adenosylcobinamide kinase/adenosylcobinamide-phosphate guanylyltransferase
LSIVLIGGGSRSGKSRYALSLARQYGPRRGFLATAQALDDEMKQRIGRHRQERGPDFTTIEEPLDLAGVILAQQGALDVLVIDCLTLWLSNLLLSGLEPGFEEFLQTAAESPLQCILVTNEVGCGIVPENDLARRFRDLAGTLNQQAAARATAVYWMIFGVPLRVV